MKRPKIIRTKDGELAVERFSALRRTEHWLIIISFFGLVFTGFPQKYPTADVSAFIIALFGGLDTMRLIHRVLGFVMAFHAVVHILAAVAGVLSRRMNMTLMPIPQDLRDARETLRYYFGARKDPPKLPKFDYRQKFEYVGLIIGTLVMVVSGFILIFPTWAAYILPGELIMAARVAHSNEAVLALLTIIIWHIYAAVFSPEVFPLDKTMLSGHMSAEELEERHALEYERVFGKEATPHQPK